jgi:hypothetical protein
MRVTLEGESSQQVTVDSGVQETVPGPILFLYHINDLPDTVKSSVRLFADDCLLYREINSQNDHNKLQKDLENLEKLAENWGMRFNATKCYIMSIKKKTHTFYQLGGHILEQVDSNSYLGLQISEDLKWNTVRHISNITKTANSTIGFLRRNLQHCPKEYRKNTYISLVRSVLEYGATIWDPYQKNDIEKLEKIQRRGARFINNDYRSREEGCIAKMLKELNLTILEERRKQQRLIFFYKVAEGQIPAMPSSDFITRNEGKRLIRPKKFDNCISTNIVTRQSRINSKSVKVPEAKSEQYKNYFFVRTAIDWNNLEDNIVQSKTTEDFKTAIFSCQRD